uniref:Uncharacterized protein n=1 Tax=Cotesia sesamiae Kitale bracovirus TaxID=452648 RepID=S0DH34_9VIRU|nr:conserved hypothetical protein BV5 [Cotesia sesamiae Kitale bracovirus]
MHHGKTAIFLFFLIIGTSMFPNGSSTGLANAKPIGPLAIVAGASLGMEIINNLMPKDKHPAAGEYGRKIVYGAETTNDGNTYNNRNVRGPVSFGSTAVQRRNYYGN